MRKTTLAVMISSVLLGAVAAQAEPSLDPSQNQQAQATDQQAQATSPTDTNPPTSPPASSDAATGKDTSSTDVGSVKSNVDEKSSSGSYYPYSAGTVGDDPSKPTSTAVATDLDMAGTSGNKDRWVDADSDGDTYLSQAELSKVAPTLSASFAAMDVDSDKKLTRDEFRTWHESHKAKMDADQGANPSPADSQNSSTTSTTEDSTSRPSSVEDKSGD